ncbi:MAG: hypothetical protein N2169_06135 [bacterium]|nr:hypothetical protein [bacterium]
MDTTIKNSNLILNTTYTKHNEDEKEKDIPVGKALKSLAAAAADGFVSTVGYTGSTIYHLPKAVYEAAKSIIKTDVIGPNLKVLCLALLPLATVLTPAMATIGSLGYGIFNGFGKALDENKTIKQIINEEIQNIKEFHNDLVPNKIIKGITKIGEEKLEEGEKPTDIKIIESIKGLIGGVIGMAIDSIGATAITAINLPELIFKGIKETIKETKGQPVKRTLLLSMLAIAGALALPASTVGGAVYGLYKGTKEGYQNGILESIKENVKSLEKYHEILRDLIGK